MELTSRKITMRRVEQSMSDTESSEDIYERLASCAERLPLPAFANRGDGMRNLIIVLVVCSATFLALAQTSPSQWQPGTITAVTPHQAGSVEHASDTVRYDVSIKVGNTVYVVLYTPPNGSNTVEYRRG